MVKCFYRSSEGTFVCPEGMFAMKGGDKVDITCFIRDEGLWVVSCFYRPIEADIQVWASNHLWVLQSKAAVLSAKEKAVQTVRWVP